LTTPDVFSQNAIIPVVTLASARQATPLARALVAGGISVIEVALRSAAALEAIGIIRDEVPEIAVGAGTVKTPDDFSRAVGAGATFLVSPGATVSLLEAAARWDVPFLPGAVTPGEMILLEQQGFDVVKLFPAAAAGGIPLLKSLAGPFPLMRFCPSGGIDAGNFRDYLRLGNVIGVSGSWITPADAIEAGDWQHITDLARAALDGVRHA